MRWLSLLVLPLLLGADPPAEASAPRVEFSLLAAPDDGGALLGLRYRIAPGWHIYWENPGDSGMATSATVEAPTGWTAGPLQFPGPVAFGGDDLVSYGYADEVVLLVPLVGSGGGTVTVESRWLVCKDICEPESATATLDLGALAVDASLEPWRGRIPREATADDRVTVTRAGDQLTITSAAPATLFPSVPLELALGGARPTFREESVKGEQVWLLRATIGPTEAGTRGVLALGPQRDRFVRIEIPPTGSAP